jgi:hypothetical protein
MQLRIIETGRPLQPHHGGIAAWHRSAARHDLARWLRDPERQERATGYIQDFIAHLVGAAYETAGITYSKVNRTTVGYNHANYDYLEAPGYTERLRAFVVPLGATSEQLFLLQHHIASGFQAGIERVTAQVHDLVPDTFHAEYAELAFQQALGALPTLHTVDVQTPAAVHGVWVPNIGINQDGVPTPI